MVEEEISLTLEKAISDLSGCDIFCPADINYFKEHREDALSPSSNRYLISYFGEHPDAIGLENGARTLTLYARASTNLQKIGSLVENEPKKLTLLVEPETAGSFYQGIRSRLGFSAEGADQNAAVRQCKFLSGCEIKCCTCDKYEPV